MGSDDDMVTLPIGAELDNAVRKAAADDEPFLLAIRPERIGILEKVPPDERTATATTNRPAATDCRATRATNATRRRST